MNTLYRKVCLKELKDIQSRLFHIPESSKYDVRKWFTESLIGASRFQNPYVNVRNNPEVLLQIKINPSFFEREDLKRLILDKNYHYKFYQNLNFREQIIVCPTHLVTRKYLSYGIVEEALTMMNEATQSITFFHLNETCDLYLKEYLGVTDISELPKATPQSQNFFYIAMPYDLALALLDQHLIFTEGMKAGKKKKISRDIDTLKKEEPNLPIFCMVELENIIEANIWLQNLTSREVWELDVKDILRINNWIKDVYVVDYDLQKGQHHIYTYIGSNQRKLHIPQKKKEIYPLSEKEWSELRAQLSKEITENSIMQYFPFLKTMKDCHQLEPKHIDDVWNHTIKSIKALKQVIDTLSFAYTPSEKDIFIMQLALLFHDVGKPYAAYNENVDRYTQFIHHYQLYGKKIMEKVFQNIPEKNLLEIMSSLSIVTGKKQYHYLFEKLKAEVEEKDIEKYIWMMFLMKTAHIISLKPQKFCRYYQDQLTLPTEFLKYNERTWRNCNQNNSIITYELLEKLPCLEALLQPENEIKPDEMIEELNPILLELLDSDITEKYNQDFMRKKSEYKKIGKQLDMKTAIHLLKSSPYYDIFYYEISSIRKEHILKSKIHGIYHNEKVAFFTMLIAILKQCNGKEISLLLKAAIYHDCGRENDHDETQHGQLGAYKFQELFHASISEEDMNLLCFLIESHAVPDSSINEMLIKYHVPIGKIEQYRKLLQILKDADGLDRVRISIDLPYSKLNPDYLRNQEALTLIQISHQLNECYSKQVIYEGNLIPKNVYQKKFNL